MESSPTKRSPQKQISTTTLFKFVADIKQITKLLDLPESLLIGGSSSLGSNFYKKDHKDYSMRGPEGNQQKYFYPKEWGKHGIDITSYGDDAWIRRNGWWTAFFPLQGSLEKLKFLLVGGLDNEICTSYENAECLLHPDHTTGSGVKLYQHVEGAAENCSSLLKDAENNFQIILQCKVYPETVHIPQLGPDNPPNNIVWIAKNPQKVRPYCILIKTLPIIQNVDQSLEEEKNYDVEALMNLFQLTKEDLNPFADANFSETSIQTSKKKCGPGGKSKFYHDPIGWKKFGLKTEGRYKKNAWASLKETKGEWYLGYIAITGEQMWNSQKLFNFDCSLISKELLNEDNSSILVHRWMEDIEYLCNPPKLLKIDQTKLSYRFGLECRVDPEKVIKTTSKLFEVNSAEGIRISAILMYKLSQKKIKTMAEKLHFNTKIVSEQKTKENHVPNIEAQEDIINLLTTDQQDVSEEFEKESIIKKRKKSLELKVEIYNHSQKEPLVGLKEMIKTQQILGKIQKNFEEPNFPLLLFKEELEKEHNILFDDKAEITQNDMMTLHLLFCGKENEEYISTTLAEDEKNNFEEFKKDPEAAKSFKKKFQIVVGESLSVEPEQVLVFGMNQVAGAIQIDFIINSHEPPIKQIPLVEGGCKKKFGNAYKKTKKEKLVSNFSLNLNQFDHNYDRDYRNCENQKIEERGPPGKKQKYFLPLGWKRTAFKVTGKYENDNWLAMNENSEEWWVAYHGYGDTLGEGEKGISKIMEQEFRTNSVQKFSNYKCILHNNEHDVGEGIFLTNRIETAALKTKPIQLTSLGLLSRYLVVFQCRVHPDHVHVPQKIGDNSGYNNDYWVVEDPKYIRPYGLLLKEISNEQ